MRICTINVPNAYLECISVLTDMGYFPSRSEAVRQALAKFVSKELGNMEQLTGENFKEIKQEQLKFFLNNKDEFE